MVIEGLREADKVLKDPYEEKMKQAPIDCDKLRWAWRGWCCWPTENRRTHLMQPCPLAYNKGKCLRGEES